jgi:hypothetical protein
MNRLVGILLVAAFAAISVQYFTFRVHLGRTEEESASIRAKLAEAESTVASQEQRITQLAKELEQSKAAANEVHKLRGEVTQLRSALQTAEKSKTKGNPKAASPAVAEAAAPAINPQNITEMARQVGNLRNKAFGGAGPLTPEERQYLQTLKPELEKLEKSPKEFSQFQAGLIQSATGIDDPAKVEQIRGIIEKVYDRAVSQGLDITSRRDDATWVDQRHQLDRRGTQAVQNLLNENERAVFDRSFLGVMGVDLGTGVDKSLYPPGFFGSPPPQEVQKPQ